MGNPGPPRRPGPKKRDLTSTDIGDPSPEAGPYNSRRCLRLGFFFLPLIILPGYMLDIILNLDYEN